MVAAEDQRNVATVEAFDHQLGVLGARRCDFFQILCVRIAFLFLLGDRDGDVAGVFYDVAERFEACFQPGDAHRRGPHVHAAARRAQIERHTDDADFLVMGGRKRSGRGGHE